MEDGNNFSKEEIYSNRVRAGKRRTYFFDVRTTRSNDYFITITESKKRYNDDGYERHKLHLYKEDFHKFVEAMQDTVNYVKTDLMPEYDFDEFSHQYDDDERTRVPKKEAVSEEVEAETEVEEVKAEIEEVAEPMEEEVVAEVEEDAGTDVPAADDGDAETWD